MVIKTSRNIKNEKNMTLQNDLSNLPVIDPNHVVICKLPNEKFKIAALRKFNELRENTETEYNEIRKTIHKQNEKFNKEEIIKKKILR